MGRGVRFEDAPPDPNAAPPASGGAPSGSPDPAPGAAPTPPTSTPPDWRSSLPAEIKDHPCLKDFKGTDDAVKAYVNAQRLIGVDKLPIPPKDAKPEVREKFMNDVYDRLGRPKEAKDYKITNPKLPDGINIPVAPTEIDAFKGEAHKLGLLPHQVDGIYQFYMASMANQLKQHGEIMTGASKDAEADLRQEYGAAYDAKVAKAKNLLQKTAGDDFKQLLDSGFGNNPAVIRYMAKMADMISEDSFVKGDEATMTPKEAQDEISKIRANSSHPYFVKSHPDHNVAVKRMTDLYEMAHPSTG